MNDDNSNLNLLKFGVVMQLYNSFGRNNFVCFNKIRLSNQNIIFYNKAFHK